MHLFRVVGEHDFESCFGSVGVQRKVFGSAPTLLVDDVDDVMGGAEQGLDCGSQWREKQPHAAASGLVM